MCGDGEKIVIMSLRAVVVPVVHELCHTPTPRAYGYQASRPHRRLHAIADHRSQQHCTAMQQGASSSFPRPTGGLSVCPKSPPKSRPAVSATHRHTDALGSFSRNCTVLYCTVHKCIHGRVCRLLGTSLPWECLATPLGLRECGPGVSRMLNSMLLRAAYSCSLPSRFATLPLCRFREV